MRWPAKFLAINNAQHCQHGVLFLNFLYLTSSQLLERLQTPSSAEALSAVAGVSAVIIDDEFDEMPVRFMPGCVVISTRSNVSSHIIDIALEPDQDIDPVLKNCHDNPIAAATLVQLVRENESRTVASSLFAESLAYSTLQHSNRFEDWLTGEKPTSSREFKNPPIRAERRDDILTLTLDRPENRNAWSTAMRDALAEHLELAILDDCISRIELRANGPAFGAGGDLTEFGSARDAGIAHIARQTRSPALLMSLLSEKITVYVHGACVGAGIELPAFAGNVKAQHNAFFQLPEVSFGLIPGAGGTASILKRVGRTRFNYMALSGSRIEANTALKWHLIDSIES